MLSVIPKKSDARYASDEWIRQKQNLKVIRSLAYDLQNDSKVRTLILDAHYAAKLYSTLTSNMFEHLETGSMWSATSRWIGEFIALSRPYNEDYLDFYAQCEEGVLFEEALEDIYRVGWIIAKSLQTDLEDVKSLLSEINAPS